MVSGALDSPLTALGRQQARLAGTNAARFFQFDLVVSSPMLRARETAETIVGVIEQSPRLVVLDDLRERDLGEMEGKSYADAPRYNGNYEDVEATPGLEPIEALAERAAKVLEDLKERPEQRILIVCHNGIGRMLRTVAHEGKPLDLYKQPRLDHAIIYEL